MQPHYKGTSPFISVILIGDCRVGKTSFLNCIVKKSIQSSVQNLPPTIGVEYAPTKINIRGQDIKVNLWDTCIKLLIKRGQNSTSPSLLPTTAGAMGPSLCSISLTHVPSPASRTGSRSWTERAGPNCRKSSLPISWIWFNLGRNKGRYPKKKS